MSPNAQGNSVILSNNFFIGIYFFGIAQRNTHAKQRNQVQTVPDKGYGSTELVDYEFCLMEQHHGPTLMKVFALTFTYAT